MEPAEILWASGTLAQRVTCVVGFPLPHVAGVQWPWWEPRCPASPDSVLRLWPPQVSKGMQCGRLAPSWGPTPASGALGGVWLWLLPHPLCQALPQVARKEAALVLELDSPDAPHLEPSPGLPQLGPGPCPRPGSPSPQGSGSGRLGSLEAMRLFPSGLGLGLCSAGGGRPGQEAEDRLTDETQASLRLKTTTAGPGWTVCGVDLWGSLPGLGCEGLNSGCSRAAGGS